MPYTTLIELLINEAWFCKECHVMNNNDSVTKNITTKFNHLYSLWATELAILFITKNLTKICFLQRISSFDTTFKITIK